MTPDYDKLFNELATTRSDWIVAVKVDGKAWLKSASFKTEAEAVEYVSKLSQRNKTLSPNAKRVYAVGEVVTSMTFKPAESKRGV